MNASAWEREKSDLRGKQNEYRRPAAIVFQKNNFTLATDSIPDQDTISETNYLNIYRTLHNVF